MATDITVLAVHLADLVSRDLFCLYLGPLDQRVERRVHLLHRGPELDVEFLPLLLESPKTLELTTPPLVQAGIEAAKNASIICFMRT